MRKHEKNLEKKRPKERLELSVTVEIGFAQIGIQYTEANHTKHFGPI